MKGRLSHVVFCAFAAASALCVSAALSGCDEVASLFQSGKNPQNVAELCDGKHTGRHAAYQSVIDEACRKLKDAESSNSRLREQSESDRQASRESESLDQSACLAKIRAFHEQSLRLYQELLDAGVCREQARGVLPQNLMTTFWATVDLNNLLKFLELRDSPHAQWEIREYASAIKSLIRDDFPHIAAIQGW